MNEAVTLTAKEQKAKDLIESLKPLQENTTPNGYVFPCPRCGYGRMATNPVKNALSRRANVYICSVCGMEEAMMDMAKKPPLPFAEWGMVKGFGENEEENQNAEVEE